MRSVLVYPELGYEGSRVRECRDYGIPQGAIDDYIHKGNNDDGAWPADTWLILHYQFDWRVRRLHPAGVSGLGIYLGDMVRQFRGTHDAGWIVDYGCNAWVDASAAFAQAGMFSVQLVDVNLPSLEFAAWKLERLGIPSSVFWVQDTSCEVDEIVSDAALVIESTAFEHVANIRDQFAPLMQKIRPGGWFLTNYTRLDWGRPDLDGFPESHAHQPAAIAFAESIAERAAFDPEQTPGDGWDLWVVK